MTEFTKEMQRSMNAHFTGIMRQKLEAGRGTVLSNQLQAMFSTAKSTLHSIALFQQTVSPDVIFQHKNELGRALIISLRNNEWNEQDSKEMVPVINWLLRFREKRHAGGGFLAVSQNLVEMASQRLTVSPQQRQAWKQKITAKPARVPSDIGRQAVDVYPRPVLRGVHIGRD